MKDPRPSANLTRRTEVFSQRVEDWLAPAPARLERGATVSEAVEALAGASSAVVVDEEGLPEGIVTEQDVVRRAWGRSEPGGPVQDIMTRPVHTIHRQDLLFRGIARMRASDLRHMPAVDDQGRVCGVLELESALLAVSPNTLSQISRLAGEESIEELARVKQAQRSLARELVDESLAVPDIQALLTHLNNDLYQQVLCHHLRSMRRDGHGGPPVDFCLIVMGSGGRGENFLTPDQDNGLILADYPDADHEHVDGWFAELADRVTRDMDRVGLEYCPGYVMAINPVWRKTISQWKAQVDGWVERARPQSLRMIDIFFDFDSIHGDLELGQELRRHVAETARENAPLLRALQHGNRGRGVGLGWFGRFQTERDKPEFRGQINLKQSGTLPLIGTIRVMALREGITETGTLARIRALHESGTLGDDEADYLAGAFRLLGRLILRRQVHHEHTVHNSGYFLPPEELSLRERHELRGALRAIRRLHNRLYYLLAAESPRVPARD